MRFFSKAVFAVLLVSWNLMATDARAAVYTIKEGNIEFQASVKPGNFKVEGKGARPTGQISLQGQEVSGTITTELKDFQTGLERRDQHLRQTLRVDQNPKAIVELKSVDLGEKTFEGLLSLHGEKKTLTGTFERKGDEVQVAFPLELSKFLIQGPSFMGMTVQDQVQVQVKLVLQEGP